MEMFAFAGIVLSLTILALALRPLTILFHELGHAIPAALLTNEKVNVYLGSYGDPAKSLHFSVGKLSFWIRYNPLTWRGGLCVPTAQAVSFNRQIVYLICGPLASLAVAVVAFYSLFYVDMHGFVKLVIVILTGSAILDFFVNIIPSSRPIQLHNGKIVHNDGRTLQKVLYYKRLPKEYSEALRLYNNKEYEKAAALADELHACYPKQIDFHRIAIAFNIAISRYEKARSYEAEFLKKHTSDSNDLCNSGVLKGFLGQKDESLKAFDESLKLNPSNWYTFNNRGYLYIIWNRFEEAITDFNKALELNPDFSFSFNNRGLAKIKLGDEQGGLDDIRKAMETDPNDSYCFRNLGIYHLDKGEYPQAREYLYKAQNLNNYTHLIHELIQELETREAGPKKTTTAL